MVLVKCCIRSTYSFLRLFMLVCAFVFFDAYPFLKLLKFKGYKLRAPFCFLCSFFWELQRSTDNSGSLDRRCRNGVLTTLLESKKGNTDKMLTL